MFVHSCLPKLASSRSVSLQTRSERLPASRLNSGSWCSDPTPLPSCAALEAPRSPIDSTSSRLQRDDLIALRFACPCRSDMPARAAPKHLNCRPACLIRDTRPDHPLSPEYLTLHASAPDGARASLKCLAKGDVGSALERAEKNALSHVRGGA